MELGLRTETFQQEDHSWLGSAHGTDATRSITLDTTKFTAGTHYPNGYFPSGLPLGQITAGGKFGPYDDTAVDGRQTCVGFLMTSVRAPRTAGAPVVGALLDHGKVVTARLPLAVDANGRADVAGRIQFL
ncbi:head decoration protein [Kitasatospora sp. MBT66]|uniref:head decoration protein n=1 Tax=Kitasatospora sp. MBT66 TaxID=1444769 RepID=UPI0005BC032C|nr:head decoration protein [Kitasatospora sp. MBT66]